MKRDPEPAGGAGRNPGALRKATKTPLSIESTDPGLEFIVFRHLPQYKQSQFSGEKSVAARSEVMNVLA